jgi:hypothetical protein
MGARKIVFHGTPAGLTGWSEGTGAAGDVPPERGYGIVRALARSAVVARP